MLRKVTESHEKSMIQSQNHGFGPSNHWEQFSRDLQNQIYQNYVRTNRINLLATLVRSVIL